MPVPKKKTTRTKRGMRRSHDGLALPGIATCPSCGAAKAPHRVCPSCGTYKDEQVITVKEV